ncbi:hypothetical protein ACVLVH_004669 [Kluyvera sp. 1366]
MARPNLLDVYIALSHPGQNHLWLEEFREDEYPLYLEVMDFQGFILAYWTEGDAGWSYTADPLRSRIPCLEAVPLTKNEANFRIMMDRC